MVQVCSRAKFEASWFRAHVTFCLSVPRALLVNTYKNAVHYTSTIYAAPGRLHVVT